LTIWREVVPFLLRWDGGRLQKVPKPQHSTKNQQPPIDPVFTTAPVEGSQTPVIRPDAYALPTTGRDPWFNCTRSWYYADEKAGLIRLVRIRGRGKLRGITRVPYDEMAKLFNDARQ
jgi:hypothetical protein